MPGLWLDLVMESRGYASNQVYDFVDANTGRAVSAFTANSPTVRSEDIRSIYEDGVNVLYAKYENVVDTISLVLYADTPLAVWQKLAQLEVMMTWAHQLLQSETSIQLFLVYNPFYDDGAPTLYRSPVYKMNFVGGDRHVEEYYDHATASQPAYNFSGKHFMRVDIEVERAHYWERTTETELSLYNIHASGSGQTGGVEVDYVNDTNRDNFVTIGLTNTPAGGLPAPIYMEVQNGTGTEEVVFRDFVVALRSTKVWAGTYWQDWYEGEGGDEISGTVVADSDCSAGYKLSYNTTAASWTQLASWTLAKDYTAEYGYKWYHLVAYFPSVVAGTEIKWTLEELNTPGNGMTYWTSQPYVLAASDAQRIVDFGVVRIPPWLGSYNSSLSRLFLQLHVKKASGSCGCTLDYFCLLPCSAPDAFVQFTDLTPGTGTGFGSDDRLCYDTVYGKPFVHVYVDSTTGAQMRHVVEGPPLYLIPGNLHRLMFLFPHKGFLDAQATVRMWYRERYLRL